MDVLTPNPATHDGIWDDRHVKALLRFARSPIGLIQQNPWHRWIGQRGGLRMVYAYLAEYPFASAHRRMIEVVLATPEAVADVYADTLHMSRATFFNHLPGVIAAAAQALNQWELTGASATQSAFPSSVLPNPLTPLIGVDEQVASLELLLARPDVRLLVLLGPGGIGKSRLAIALAQRQASPACFVDLAAVTSACAAPAEIAAALGIENASPATLKRALGAGDFLLVLDNLEHIPEVQRLATELLLVCPALKIIVTSRLALHMYGEHEYVVPPLATTCARVTGKESGPALSFAAELFVERARTVRPGFCATPENRAAIEAICRHVQGNPLAIEFAAFQTKYYAPRTILERLEQDALAFLGEGIKSMPIHQRGVSATLDWSYNLLAPDAQRLLAALSALPGRFTAHDAERLAPGAADGLTTLVDHSLLLHELAEDEVAYFEMPELMRQYARAKKGSAYGSR